MNRHIYLKFILVPLLPGYILSCSVLKNPGVGEREGCDGNQIIRVLNERQITEKCFVYKNVSIVFEQGNDVHNFDAVIKVVKDTGILVSVRPAMGIEAFRLVLTNDSIILVDRMNRKIYSGFYREVLNRYGIMMELNELQRMLSGLLIGDINKPKAQCEKEYVKIVGEQDSVSKVSSAIRLNTLELANKGLKMKRLTFHMMQYSASLEYKNYFTRKGFEYPGFQQFNVMGGGKSVKITLNFNEVGFTNIGDWRSYGGRSYERIKL